MKNLVLLTEPRAAHEYVYGLWQTEAFRRSHNDRQGFIHGIIDKFAQRPRFFYDLSDDVERSHFSAWWGGIQRRYDYRQPAVSDLFYLHEIFHAATMTYLPGATRKTVFGKLGRNEAEASAISEIVVYFALPEIRDQSFLHEIYADRLLDDSDYRLLFYENPDYFTEHVIGLRANIMQKDYKPRDDVEMWIQQFAEQNRRSGQLWRDRYDLVENAMWKLTLESLEDRDAALANLLSFLQSPEITEGTDIPFYSEAVGFYDVFRDVRARYDKAAASFHARPGPANAEVLVPEL